MLGLWSRSEETSFGARRSHVMLCYGRVSQKVETTATEQCMSSKPHHCPRRLMIDRATLHSSRVDMELKGFLQHRLRMDARGGDEEEISDRCWW